MREAERDRGPCRAPARERGFTLMELMFTLVVAGLLLTVGVPSYMDIVRNSRAAANANELVGALSIARSEAIRRGTRVTLCRSANLATCGGTWTDGWIVFQDGAATDDGTEVVSEIIRVWPTPVGSASLTVTGNPEWVRFLPRGTIRTDVAVAMPINFNIEVSNCTEMQGRNVSINLLGRTTVERAACP